MGRRPGTAKICVICGDKAKGINFNAATCMSCKAFFRRNALHNKPLKCPFNDSCKIDVITRRFCTKCRLRKCFENDMKKEWILTEDERQVIKEKIKQNKAKRAEDLERQLKKVQEMIAADNCSSGSSPSLSSAGPLSVQSSFTTTASSLSTSSDTQPDLLASLMPTILSTPRQNSSPNHVSAETLDPSLSELCDEFLQQPDESIMSTTSDILRDLDALPSPFNSSAVEPIDEATDQSNQVALYAPSQPQSQFDSILDFVPRYLTTHLTSHLTMQSTSNFPLYREIGFPYRQLILPEAHTLHELTNACTILQNPYKQVQYLDNYSVEEASRITEYIFHRLIKMCKALNAFNQLNRADQGALLKGSLLKMLSIRTVINYNASRECWNFVDDNKQLSVFVQMEYIRPFCTKCGYQRHRALPGLFRQEWKDDSIIFDLLTAIVMFTPRPEYSDGQQIKDEHSRYVHLLYRYLALKYPSPTEAEQCFRTLLANIEEMVELNDDIVNFMRSFAGFADQPFYVQLLDLDTIGTADVGNAEPANIDTSNAEQCSISEVLPSIPKSSGTGDSFVDSLSLWA